MKRNIKLLSLLAVSFVIIFSSCKKDGNDPSPEDARAEELSATWVIVSTSENTDFAQDVTITFNAENLTYSVSNLEVFEDNNLNHGPILAGEGSFSVDPENTDLVSLTPGGDVTIMSVDKESGDLSVSYSAPYPKANDDEQTITLDLELQ